MRAEDARAILDAAEAGTARLAELADLNRGLADVAERNAEASVALLSLVPFLSTDAVGLGFVSDAMGSVRESTHTILKVQTALRALVEHELTNVRRLQALAAEGEDEPGFSERV